MCLRFICCKLTFAVCLTKVICWRKDSACGLGAGACGRLDGNEMESDSCQEGSGFTRIRSQQLGGGGLPVWTPDQPQKPSLGRHGTLHQCGANGREKARTFFALLWTHWYNDCACGWECVCVCPCSFSTPSVIFFCNNSFTSKACCLKSCLFGLWTLNKMAIFPQKQLILYPVFGQLPWNTTS